MLRAPPPHGTYMPGLMTRIVLGLSQNTPLGRGKARKLMAAWVRQLCGENLDTQLFGQNVRLHMRNNSSEVKALMNPRRYSRAEFIFCKKHMPKAMPVLVDIGANAGLFSLGMIGHMRGGNLIAVEPQEKLFARLELNLVSLNAHQTDRPNVHLYKTAIGPEAGALMLSVPDQLGQASARALLGAEQIAVPVRPLQDVLAEAGVARVDVMKLDVEGYEDAVLFPFLEAAPRALWPSAIVLEHCHSDRWVRDCEAGLIAAGYCLMAKDRTNFMFARERP